MIKMSFLRSSLHNNKGLDEINEKFISEIENNLNEKIFKAELTDYRCDLKLIFIESGGSEGLFLANIDKLKEPYYLLTSGNNNSLAASMEIMTYLNLRNKSGEILHGDSSYIAKRIAQLVKINDLKRSLHNIRLGIIGKPSDWLISSIPGVDLLKERLGASLINIDIKELQDLYNKADYNDFSDKRELIFDKNSLNDSKRMYLAIKEIKNKYKLDGLTIRCFDLLDSCKTTSCLAFAILNASGIVSACEGDIMSLLSMEIAKLYLNEPAFQANPSRIDVVNRKILFAHCTVPFSMVDNYKLDTHYESGIGVAIKGDLRLEEATIFRMSSDLKHYFVTEGLIEDNLNLKNLCRTQIIVKCDSDINELFTNPCGNHHIIIYGRHKNEIDLLMKSLGFKRY